MRKIHSLTTLAFLLLASNATLYANPCPFDKTKDCALQRDILNDIGSNKLKYYAPTNYDHRMSGEINVYDASLTQSYTDSNNKPGQLKFIANIVNPNFWKSGEFMTRANLNAPPFNSPTASNPWTTKEAKHGYVEVVVRMPKCDSSTDGACQSGKAANSYAAGLWPAIWMMPTNDANWPYNAEIDISEAYLKGTDYRTSTATLHFNGNDGSCSYGDCVGAGYPLRNSVTATVLWSDFHTWGFEWQPDPTSGKGGYIITGYFDNQKAWGPLRTDTLPADGSNALSRGFNDPNGGYYLIVNLAIGGPYAGGTNGLIQSSSMYVQSAKSYTVSDVGPPPTNSCLPPVDIRSMISQDKKQITIAWLAPTGSAPIQYYQVADWQHHVIWKGSSATNRSYQDQSLPGTPGNFYYFLSTVCDKSTSPEVEHIVNVTIHH